MKQNLLTSPFSDIRLASAPVVVDGAWVVEAQKLSAATACPQCQVVSSARHSSYQRRLWDLPIQGRPVRITLTVGQSLPDRSAPRVVGLDVWASKKGLHYGTIAVDLERRTVIDVLPERSAVNTARWLAGRPSIELIARGRDGTYADASRQGAPQARQIADRFHLIQNLRVAIERQLSGLERPIRGYRANPGRRVAADSPQLDGNVGEDEARELPHVSGRPFLLAAFAKVRAMYDAGKGVAAISRELRLTRRIVDKWVRLDSLPERARIAPRSSTPSKFVTYLRDRWTLGETNVRRLLQEVREQGYTGCYSRLAAFVAPWPQKAERQPTTPSPIGLLPLDPRTGGVISPIIAAALCIKSRGLLTPRQAEKVDILQRALPVLAYMRHWRRPRQCEQWRRSALYSATRA